MILARFFRRWFSGNGKKGRVIAFHHRLGYLLGHRYTEAVGLLEDYRSRGKEVLFFISSSAHPKVTKNLRARAVLDDPTFRLEWSFEERTRLFTEMLHRHIDPVVSAQDRFFLTVATQLETNALARWLRELPPEKKPWVVTVFLSDRWNRQGPEERARQVAEFDLVREELKNLSADENQKLILMCVEERLSLEIGGFLDRKIIPVPMPLRYEDGPPPQEVVGQSEVRLPMVTVLGGLRPEKGSALLPGIVRACADTVPVRFTLQMVNEGLNPEDLARVLALADEPSVTALPRELELAEYADAMKAADLGLFPYTVISYTQRSSAVFAEAIAYGKPAVVPEGTWLARQIEEGLAAGVICRDLTPEGYARSIAACVADLPALTARARSLADAWKKSTSMREFTTRVENEIARREKLLSDA